MLCTEQISKPGEGKGMIFEVFDNVAGRVCSYVVLDNVAGRVGYVAFLDNVAGRVGYVAFLNNVAGRVLIAQAKTLITRSLEKPVKAADFLDDHINERLMSVGLASHVVSGNLQGHRP